LVAQFVGGPVEHGPVVVGQDQYDVVAEVAGDGLPHLTRSGDNDNVA
jgi:hypothetical protein